MNTKTALDRLVDQKTKDPDFQRLMRFGALLEHFHLKQTITEKVEGRRIFVNGKEVINFGSANYLGLDQHPAIIEASVRGLRELGNHSGCSRMFSSHYNLCALEDEISKLVGAEKTLVCANVSQVHEGVVPALWGNSESVLFIDRFAHASIYQSALIAKAKGCTLVRIDISNLEEVRDHIKKYPSLSKAVLIDGVYSMQGGTPPLNELSKICLEMDSVLYIDDAHGIGIFGAKGGGVVEQYEMSFQNLLLVGSLQKGLGAFGGFISGDGELIDYLRCQSKSYVFSGTLQPSAVEGAREALRISVSEEGQGLRSRLIAISKNVRAGLCEMGFSVPLEDSPIVPVFIGHDITTLMAGRKMFDLGIFINSVLYPAVPREEGILRISLTTAHSDADIMALLEAFRELKAYLKVHDSVWSRYLHVSQEVIKSKIQGADYVGL